MELKKQRDEIKQTEDITSKLCEVWDSLSGILGQVEL